MYTLNEFIVIEILKCADVGGSMIIHAFGAFYGIAITWVFYKPQSWAYKHFISTHSSYSLAMIGTLFLWCFWPSFNAALASTPVEIYLGIVNTYFSLIGSVLGAYWLCTMRFGGKFQMDIILNATLAGGVVMGASADIIHKGYVSYIIGFLTGILSAFLFEKSPHFLKKMKIHDVAGVFNLHGIPGLLGGLISAITRQVYGDGNGAR